jgi:hypothetical protein
MPMRAPISRPLWEKAAPRPPRLLFGFVLLLSVSLAMAQNNLGELLDTGAKVLSAEEFKYQLVQRVIVGLTATGGNLEIMYVENGTIQGIGFAPSSPGNQFVPVNGEWKIDEKGKICSSIRIGLSVGSYALPFRCQVWFKLADQYYLSDSDSDRHARVLRRTVKQ